MSRNRTNTITRGMLALLVDGKRVLLDFISVGLSVVIGRDTGGHFVRRCRISSIPLRFR